MKFYALLYNRKKAAGLASARLIMHVCSTAAPAQPLLSEGDSRGVMLFCSNSAIFHRFDSHMVQGLAHIVSRRRIQLLASKQHHHYCFSKAPTYNLQYPQPGPFTAGPGAAQWVGFTCNTSSVSDCHCARRYWDKPLQSLVYILLGFLASRRCS